MSSHAAPSAPPAHVASPLALPRLSAGAALACALGAVFAYVCFKVKAGGSLPAMTTVEIGLTLGGGSLACAAALAAPTPRRAWGAVTVFLFAALVAWTAVSVVWSVQPADSWLDANRMIAYLAVFAGGIALARLAPDRAGALVVAVLLGVLTVCTVALMIKSFPNALNSKEELARLREPLDYWNALGLLAALGVPCCLWVGARRGAAPASRTVAPALCALLLVTLLLSFSRGALIASGVGLAVWFALVPLRLRGLAVLVPGLAGAGLVTVWAFTQDALTENRAPLGERIGAGHRLAVALVLMTVALAVASHLFHRFLERRPPSAAARRKVGLAALVAVALVPVGGAVALQLSDGGIKGQTSDAWDRFFDDSAATGSLGPDRLTSVGNKRGAYWHEANEVWRDHRWIGAGAAGFATARTRYRKDTVRSRDAHGYAHQTLADIGIVGAGISLALLVAWLLAAGRSTALRPRLRFWKPRPPAVAGPPWDASRIALVTLTSVVVTFGAHSLIDWTWLVPGVAVIVLSAAGFVAGRGPIAAPGAQRSTPVRARLMTAGAIAVIALCASWAIWQPQRAVSASESAQASLGSMRFDDARLQSQTAAKRNPLSVEPLLDLAAVEAYANRPGDAQKALERAVRLQPANAATWTALAAFQLRTLNQPTPAVSALRAALFLDPKSPAVQGLFLEAYRRLPRKPAPQSPAP